MKKRILGGMVVTGALGYLLLTDEVGCFKTFLVLGSTLVAILYLRDSSKQFS